MILREALLEDISQMHVVRTSVKENRLSNPNLISYKDYELYLNNRGKGWVVEIDALIIGFAIVDLIEKNVWALFVHPDFEGRGFGSQLHNEMLEWYFNQAQDSIWLSTSAGTKAERFYYRMGWKKTNTLPNNEIKFEMTSNDWEKQRVLNG